MKKETRLIKTWEIPKNWNPQRSKGVIPPTLKKTGITRILNRRVLDITGYLGSYGMGGPGFFGIKLEKSKKHPEEWLVLRMWGASDWLHFNNRIINCHPDQEIIWKPCKIDNVRIILLANMIKSALIRKKSCIFKFLNGHIIEFKKDPKTRPVYGGNGKIRELNWGDDLNEAWIITNRSLAI